MPSHPGGSGRLSRLARLCKSSVQIFCATRLRNLSVQIVSATRQKNLYDKLMPTVRGCGEISRGPIKPAA